MGAGKEGGAANTNGEGKRKLGGYQLFLSLNRRLSVASGWMIVVQTAGEDRGPLV